MVYIHPSKYNFSSVCCFNNSFPNTPFFLFNKGEGTGNVGGAGRRLGEDTEDVEGGRWGQEAHIGEKTMEVAGQEAWCLIATLERALLNICSEQYYYYYYYSYCIVSIYLCSRGLVRPELASSDSFFLSRTNSTLF